MSDTVTPEELAEFEALRGELLARDDVEEGLRQRLHADAEYFLTECVKAARRLEQMADPMKALQIMTEVTQWAVELRGRLGKEVAASQRPRHTTGQFER